MRLAYARWNRLSRFAPPALLLLACSSGGGVHEQVEQSTSAISGGSNDPSTPEADVVVRLVLSDSTGTFSCTGTFITPTAVLTAKHCVMGATSDLGGDGLPRPPPYLIEVGANLSALQRAFVSTLPPAFFGTATPINVQEAGIDLAIIFLSPLAPAFDYAHIVRPSLTSPSVGGSDTNGGTYGNVYPNGPIGFAGWGGSEAAQLRQSVVWSSVTMHHYPGYPDDLGNGLSGQYWDKEHDTQGGIDDGDSGGPAFVQRPDGTRDVIGVVTGQRYPSATDCGFGPCDIWTDVTRGATAQWIRSTMLDTSRSAAWLAKHGKVDQWIGEFDYTGPCDMTHDSDCDHWYDAHDYCPTFFDPLQTEGVPCPCTPVTCATYELDPGLYGAECGDPPDGCGGFLSCGTCASGDSCSHYTCTSPFPQCKPSDCVCAPGYSGGGCANGSLITCNPCHPNGGGGGGGGGSGGGKGGGGGCVGICQ